MKSKSVRRLVVAFAMALLTTVLAQVQIEIGPIPINLALVSAYLTGMVFTPLWALISMGIYLGLGALGLPIFSGFTGGLDILLGESGGYLLGYLVIALLISFAQKISEEKLRYTLIAAMLGLLACYAMGTAWFMHVNQATFEQSAIICITPFVLPDLGKLLISLIFGQGLRDKLYLEGMV